jgi:hypothetical protein
MVGWNAKSNFLVPDKKTHEASYAMLSVFALWLLFGFGYETVWQRLVVDVDGTVVESKDLPFKGAPRYSTVYKLRTMDNQLVAYVSEATDASLYRSMVVGTYVHKKKWELGYQKDQEWIAFPISFYLVILGSAVLLFLRSMIFYKRWRKQENI